MKSVSFEQIENWITFLKDSRRNAESQRNHLMNEAFRRDMKADERLTARINNNIECANELMDLVCEFRRYLRRKEREEKENEMSEDYSENDKGVIDDHETDMIDNHDTGEEHEEL